MSNNKDGRLDDDRIEELIKLTAEDPQAGSIDVDMHTDIGQHTVDAFRALAVGTALGVGIRLGDGMMEYFIDAIRSNPDNLISADMGEILNTVIGKAAGVSKGNTLISQGILSTANVFARMIEDEGWLEQYSALIMPIEAINNALANQSPKLKKSLGIRLLLVDLILTTLNLTSSWAEAQRQLNYDKPNPLNDKETCVSAATSTHLDDDDSMERGVCHRCEETKDVCHHCGMCEICHALKDRDYYGETVEEAVHNVAGTTIAKAASAVAEMDSHELLAVALTSLAKMRWVAEIQSAIRAHATALEADEKLGSNTAWDKLFAELDFSMLSEDDES